MIAFHPRQSDCARRARKNENSGMFNFTSQIAPLICAVIFTKHVKHDATIFKSRCSRMVMCYRLHTKQALLLSFVRFLRLANGSSKFQRSPARRSRNGRESSGKTTGEMSRSLPHICRSIAGLWQMQCRRMSACKLARQLASWRATGTQCPRRSPRNAPMQHPANVSQDDCSEFRSHDFKPKFQKL